MVYMGIDASTTSTGVSVFDDKQLIYYTKIQSKQADWRKRITETAAEIGLIIEEYLPEEVYMEDVPMKDGKFTLIKLSVVQGGLLTVFAQHNIAYHFVPVSEWRKHAGLFDGTKEGSKRAAMKQKSIELANRIFHIDLEYKSENSKYNDDDISDSILVAYATKYPIEQTGKKGFGRKANIKR